MRHLMGLCVLSLCFAAPAAAEHPGKGKGHGNEEASSQTPEKQAKRAASEAMDVVADELLGEQPQASGMPPGLSKKGAMPPGLEKQDKTPPGRSKGKKKGWDHAASAHKEVSAFRRLIRGVFRRSTTPKSDQPAASTAP